MEVFFGDCLLPETKELLVSEAKDYAYSHGLVLRTKDNPLSQEEVTHAPFVLFPSIVPKHCFSAAVAVQKEFNLLYHKVAHNDQFLRKCLERGSFYIFPGAMFSSVSRVDDFSRRLWHIYETVMSEGISQPVSLAMNRSDYMFDTGTEQESSQTDCDNFTHVNIKQIEFNTMASSFAGLSMKLEQLHKYMLSYHGMYDKIKHVPSNKASDGLAKAVIKAWEAYNNPNSVVLMLVLPVERNLYDQKLLEYSIRTARKDVKVIRRTIQDITERAKLDQNRKLIIDDLEVAIVYLRSLYVPEHFNSEKDWESLLMIERSHAIKCPSVNYHLAGTKKIQQVLAEPGVLESFIDDEDTVARIRATFAGQYSLDRNEKGNKNTEMAIAEPQKFVLKPQREGGGNNVFGEDIKTLLEKIKDSEERTAYILMERIFPLQLKNYAVRSGYPTELYDMVSEIGIFGTLVGTKDEILLNEHCDHILRTKTSGMDEGGVAVGVAALDTPFLI